MSKRFGRRKFLLYSSAGLGTSLLLKACAGNESANTAQSQGNSQTQQAASSSGSGDTIKVGILHSLTGTMAISETTLVDAEKLAIKQINEAGGVLGKQIEPIVEDGASDWPTFAEKASKLIEQNNVATVFGCWTSASRKAVLPVFESKNHMLWYPVQYEGQECSKNVFYTGAAPNQQIQPAVNWMLENEGKQFYLIGSDYVFPRTANTIVKQQLQAKGGEVVGEDYIPLGSTEVTPLITKIRAALPNGGVIFNTLNGDSNAAFFKQLQGAGLGPDKYPVMSSSIAEVEVKQIGAEYLQGHYAAWNYFMTVDNPKNQQWVDAFKAEYGEDRLTNDPMESAYNMVYLWKQSAEKAGIAENLEKVRSAAYGQTLQEAPQGKVTMNPNHHASQLVRIGRVREDGLFEIVNATDSTVEPEPWNEFVPATQGYACNWSDSNKGEKYKVKGT
ncbi:MAG: urea ABC transporter substrate-binding protein [Cyanobacteria bacterium QH_9_48_43]|nr:MAG: urea ABC transporter substrate-binding protein [Cyanobacteria bacterium QH_9_48_43]